MPNICSCIWVQAVPGERWDVFVGNDVLQARYVQPSGTLKDRGVTGVKGRVVTGVKGRVVTGGKDRVDGGQRQRQRVSSSSKGQGSGHIYLEYVLV